MPPFEKPEGESGENVLTWQEIRFELMWIQHGGSGLAMSFAEVNDLDIDEIVWLLEAQHERRKTESEAIKRAGRR